MPTELSNRKRDRWAAWYNRTWGGLIPRYALVSLPICLISVILYFLAQILPRFSGRRAVSKKISGFFF